MNVTKVDAITPNHQLDIYSLHKILTSDAISDYKKMQFLHKNQMQISHMMRTKISSNEFINMMDGRQLIKFRPIRNSYTKWGDKILLAKTLGVLPSQVSGYIKNVSDAMVDINHMKKLSMSRIDSIKTYVYRHGTRKQVVTFLDYELKNTKNLVETLNNTLEYGKGGLADYFARPIHRMSDKTMLSLVNVADKNIKAAAAKGLISQVQMNDLIANSLIRIYNIQHNSKFINIIRNDIK